MRGVGVVAALGALLGLGACAHAYRGLSHRPASPQRADDARHRQYFDQRRQRYYWFDPVRKRYYWEDGSSYP